MATILEQVPTGLIRGRYLLVSQDNVDDGTDPNLDVVAGTVSFTANVTGAIQTGNPELGFLPKTFNAEFDSEGYLIPAGSGAQVIAGKLERGIRLLATDSDFFNPQDFTWTVTFNLVDVESGSRVNVPPFSINVPENSTQFLPSLTPVGSSNGQVITRGASGESIYQMAVRVTGFSGTEEQFMQSVYGSGSGSFDPELIRDTLNASLRQSGSISIVVNDATNEVTFHSDATVNSTDAQLRNRDSHTGSQGVDSIDGFREAVEDIIGLSLTQGANTVITYDDVTGRTTITASGGGGITSVSAADITDSTAIGRSLIKVGTPADARSAIGAGTSSLKTGTASTDAKPGDWKPTWDDMPASATATIVKQGATWPERKTARADIRHTFIGPDPSPPIIESGVNGMYNSDVRIVTA